MALKRKGFTLFEVMLTTIILMVVGSSIAGIYMMEGATLNRSAHRLEAINYARSLAERIITGEGISNTMKPDLTLCVLPESYFTKALKGTMDYKLTGVKVGTTSGIRVDIKVEWEEKLPKKEKLSETLFFIVFKTYLNQ